MGSNKKVRFGELDALRGLAVILMVVFHAAYDAQFLGLWEGNVWEGGWLVLARITQFLFIGMAGVTMSLAYRRSEARGGASILKSLRHSAMLLGWGMVITLITWVLFKEQAVKFGVLHFYAVAGILALPLVRLGVWNGLIGVGVLALSFFVKDLTVGSPWLFPFGLTNPGFQSLDYFPLLPWFGLFLLGLAVSPILYEPERRRFGACLISRGQGASLRSALSLKKIGRYSLAIYLLHQPILFGILNFF